MPKIRLATVLVLLVAALATVWVVGADNQAVAADKAPAKAAPLAPSPPPPPVPHVIYTKDNAPQTPKLGDLPLMDKVTLYGITWTFDKKVPVGQFVNGEYYIVGPATVVAIDPKPLLGKEVPEEELEQKDRDNAKDGQFARNGSMLNMKARSFDGKVGGHVGFDSRLREGGFDPRLFAPLPISLKPGDALVSTISMKKDENFMPIGGKESSYGSDKPTVIAAVLTCLAAPQPADTFRPSYADRGQKIYLARNLRRELLPKVAPTAAFSKPLKGSSQLPTDQYIDMFQRPWIDVLPFANSAPIRSMPDYGREVGRHVGLGALLLCCDLKPEDKERLLVNFTQVGIDLWGLVEAGHVGWAAYGGHGIGRKLPIVMAGYMLNDADMMNPYKKHPNIRFQEDQQTMYDDGWTGAKAVYAGHLGRDGGQRTQGWGAYEHLEPSKWKENGGKDAMLGENYRRSCTSNAWIAQALALRLMKIEKVWNHEAFLDYCDRWMFEDDKEFVKVIQKETGEGQSFSKNWASQGQTWDPFVDEMWAKYRQTLPAPTDGWKTKKPNQEDQLSVPNWEPKK